MENKKESEVVIDEKNDPDAEVVLLEDIEVVVTPENDPEQVTKVKKEPKCNVTSVGDKVIGEGKSVLKSDSKLKEKGSRSWFDL